MESEEERLRRKQEARARGNANLRPIKKGEVRNPKGVSGYKPEFRGIRQITNDMLRDVIDAALSSDKETLEKIIKNPDTPMLKLGVAKCLYEAIRTGDWATLERIFERIIGKVPILVNNEISQGPGHITITIVDPKNESEPS